MNFADFGLAPALLRAIDASGYTVPTPIQSQTIPHILQGRDMLGCAQTGTGKTAAFALPMLDRLQRQEASGKSPRVLVLAPTRELAAQISQSFKTYGKFTNFRVTEIYGGVSQVPQVKALRQGVEIVVATPGRLVDLMNQGLVQLGRVEIFVLDEADRMLDMGFLPDLRKIIAALPSQRQTLLFSATMPREVESLASRILTDPICVRIAASKSAEPKIRQSVCMVPKKQKTALLAQLLSEAPGARVFVFTRTKHGADRVARQLSRYGVHGEAIHGNKSQNARQRTLSRFKLNHTSVLVATDIAARGLDVDAVTHVINYDVPVDAETYVHRIGRTARAGAEGIAITFCDPDERKYLLAVERLLRRNLEVEHHEIEIVPTRGSESESGSDSRPSDQGGQRRSRPRRKATQGGARSGGTGRGSATARRTDGARGPGQPSSRPGKAPRRHSRAL